MGTRIIKCPSCNTFNKNLDYCKFCNTLLSHQKKVEIKEASIKQKQVEEVIYEMEHPNFAERLKKHPFFIYRFLGWILYSVILIVSAIGAGLAWFIAMVAAG